MFLELRSSILTRIEIVCEFRKTVAAKLSHLPRVPMAASLPTPAR